MVVAMPRKLTTTFAQNLRAFREESGISQNELARVATLSVRYVGTLERAERSPTLPTVEAFADALGTTPVQLLTKMETAPPAAHP
jgi:transcriptional regulator with XRE-family HTH domain